MPFKSNKIADSAGEIEVKTIQLYGANAKFDFKIFCKS